ncbi:MAG: hypothetical protein J6C37_01085 [Roseburia sp.]|nr:hypothetical protein [Roseburia sp.]
MRAKGSITVFAALALMLVASFLFALLEAGRVYGLDTRADMVSQLSLESVCAEYQSGLWEDYHLLCLDGAYGGDSFSMEYVSSTLNGRVKRNLGGENSFFNMTLEEAEPVEYQLLTDGDGTVFLKRVVKYMKENLPAEAAKLIYEKYLQGDAVEQEGIPEDSVEAAQKAIEDAREQMEKGTDGEVSKVQAEKGAEGVAAEVQAEMGLVGVATKVQIEKGTDGESEKFVETAAGGNSESTDGNTQQESTIEVENPLEIVLKIKQNALLGLVVEDTGGLSTKEVDLSEGLLKRECLQGTDTGEEDIGWYEKILVLEYLDGYFSDYNQPAEEHALAYELEYVLCGKESDAANLEGVVKRLLLVREAANVAHILADTVKREEAMMVATSLAGFTGNPAVVKVVQIGVVAAWAYVESLLDIRALLAGDKIALIKSDAQWTVQTENLLESFEMSAKAKNCTNGLSYQSYLKQFLFFMDQSKLAYRMMDMIEQNLRLSPEYEECRMDYMICRIKYQLQYSAKPLFSGISVLGRLNAQYLDFCETTQFSYY